MDEVGFMVTKIDKIHI
ncbi:hypothetical protein ACGCJ4_13400 [Staphylococcus aureus]